MDFWTHQETAKRKSFRLVVLYVVLVTLFSLLGALVIDLTWMAFYKPNPTIAEVAQNYSGPYSAEESLNLYLENRRRWAEANQRTVVSYVSYSVLHLRFWLIFLCFPLVIGIMTLFSPTSLSLGGRSVAEAMDGSLVTPQTTEAGERRLLNVVEEMAIASGMPVPPVYVLKKEEGINAFAAGGTVNDAVIGVTQGALTYLDRAELQAVIAHEFSHVQNGDMRLNLRFAQLLFGLICLSEIGRVILRSMSRSSSGSSKNDKGKGLIMIIALICYLIGVLMAFMGRIIQAAINRQREFLADASSVQFTRTRELASALKKIGGLAAGSKIKESALVDNYSHFFFCRTGWSLLSTHPSLDMRIRRLDPEWDGIFPLPQPVREESAPEGKGRGLFWKDAAGFASSAEKTPLGAAVAASSEKSARISDMVRSPLAAAALAGSAGRAPAGGIVSGALRPGGSAATSGRRQAAGANESGISAASGAPIASVTGVSEAHDTSLSDASAESAASLSGATALLGSKPDRAEGALAKLHAACHEPLDACYLVFALLLDERPDVRVKQLASTKEERRRAEIREYRRAFELIDPNEFLPLLELAVPALKMLSPRQYETFHRAMLHFIGVDGEFSFREWVLYQLVVSQVGAQYVKAARRKVPYSQLSEAYVALLAALAMLEPEEAAAQGAFEAGLKAMLLPLSPLPEKPEPEALSQSMDVLRNSSELLRDNFMFGALKLMAHDKQLTREEAMFLRLTSLCLGRPVPERAYNELLRACGIEAAVA